MAGQCGPELLLETYGSPLSRVHFTFHFHSYPDLLFRFCCLQAQMLEKTLVYNDCRTMSNQRISTGIEKRSSAINLALVINR